MIEQEARRLENLRNQNLNILQRHHQHHSWEIESGGHGHCGGSRHGCESDCEVNRIGDSGGGCASDAVVNGTSPSATGQFGTAAPPRKPCCENEDGLGSR